MPDGSGLFAIPVDAEIPNGRGEQVLLGDIDNDRDIDAVLIAGQSQSGVFVNDGSGNFALGSTLFGPSEPSESALADFDLDGLLDIVVADSDSNRITVWKNHGNSEFRVLGTSLLAPGNPQSVQVADFNGDGNADLTVYANRQHVLINDGSGNFRISARPIGLSVVGDFDSDGDADLLANRSLGGGRLFLNDGAGDFPTIQESIVSPMSIVPLATSVGDFDGDGDLDVYESNHASSDGNGHLWLNDGTGQFTDSGQILGRKSDGKEDRDSVVGDVDLDGDLDLIVAHEWEAETYLGSTIWRNDGTGHFTPETGPLLYPNSLALGDVDTDGDLDLVAENGNYLNVSMNRTITTVEIPSSGGNFQVIRSGDDLVVRQVGGAEIFREPAAGIKTLRIRGSAGADRIDASSLNGIGLVLDGGDGNDTLIGGANADSLDGEGGDDQLWGQAGNDSLVGGNGNDTLLGGMGRDSVVGGIGNDRINGQGGADTITGGVGDDCLIGGDGIDCLVESGDVNFALRPTTLRGLGNDRLTLFEQAMLTGGDGANVLDASTSNMLVTLIGGAGDDLLRGGSRSDSFDGGDGNDTLIGNDGHDSLTGGANDDLLIGGNGNDVLNGDTGSDTLTGGNGSDKLLGGTDTDTLIGGLGNDTLDGGDATDRVAGGIGNNRGRSIGDVFLDPLSEIDELMTVLPKWLTGV